MMNTFHTVTLSTQGSSKIYKRKIKTIDEFITIAKAYMNSLLLDGSMVITSEKFEYRFDESFNRIDVTLNNNKVYTFTMIPQAELGHDQTAPYDSDLWE